MNARNAAVTLSLLITLCATPAFADEGEEEDDPTIGLSLGFDIPFHAGGLGGLSGLVRSINGSSVGLGLPFYLSRDWRLEPGISARYYSSESESTATEGLAISRHEGFELGAGLGVTRLFGEGAARPLLSGEIGGSMSSDTTTFTETAEDGSVFESERGRSGHTLFARPLVGGELLVDRHLSVGVRGGVEVRYSSSGDDPSIAFGSAGSSLSVGSYGRVEFAYYW